MKKQVLSTLIIVGSLIFSTAQGEPVRSTTTPKAPSEAEVATVLHNITLAAFENINPPQGGAWQLDTCFMAMDVRRGFVTIEELKYRLRGVPPYSIAVTHSSLKGYIDHYKDFYESSRPASYVLFAPTTYAHINPVLTCQKPFYSDIVFFWQPPNQNAPYWVLKKIQLFPGKGSL